MTPDGRFGKREHLLKTKDFRKVYGKGRSAKGGAIHLYCLPNGLGHTRIGFSIPSAAVKLASARNRIRRLFREAFRHNKSALAGGVDIVVVLNAALPKTAALADAEKIFLKLAGQAGALNG